MGCGSYFHFRSKAGGALILENKLVCMKLFLLATCRIIRCHLNIFVKKLRFPTSLRNSPKSSVIEPYTFTRQCGLQNYTVDTITGGARLWVTPVRLRMKISWRRPHLGIVAKWALDQVKGDQRCHPVPRCMQRDYVFQPH